MQATSKTILIRLCAVAAALCLGVFVPSFAALADTPAATPAAPTTTTIQAPALEVPIPSVNLSDAVLKDGTVTIPFLAQYIGGIYTFLIGIIGMVAAVMMIIGGFQYVTSAGDSGKLGAAKKRIVDAIIGVVLAFGSYIILYTLNPNLVAFNSMQLLSIKTESAETKNFFQAINDSKTDTSVGADPVAATAVHESNVNVVPPAGCPIKDPDPTIPGSGHPKFVDQIKNNQDGIITGQSVREKMVQIGYIAAACKIPLGNCGRTVGTITALAGRGQSSSCINGDTSSCVDNRGRQVHGPKTKEQRFFLYALRCGTENSTNWPVCSFPGCTANSCIWTAAQNSASTHCRRLDCVPISPGFEKNSRGDVAAIVAARNRVRDYMISESNAGRMDPGWPDAWVDDLQPGDWLVLYNGNDDLVGSHSVMFVNQGPNGTVDTVQGSPGDITRNVRWCLKKSCGNAMMPLLEVYSPQ